MAAYSPHTGPVAVDENAFFEMNYSNFFEGEGDANRTFLGHGVGAPENRGALGAYARNFF
jgi:hypothetical protein